MKLKIVNKKKFIRSIVIVVSIILGALFIINNKAFSHGDIKYESIYVKRGDTLWSIAEKEQKNNPYYYGKDIRYIIANIENINKLNNSYLIEGQELLICNI